MSEHLRRMIRFAEDADLEEARRRIENSICDVTGPEGVTAAVRILIAFHAELYSVDQDRSSLLARLEDELG